MLEITKFDIINSCGSFVNYAFMVVLGVGMREYARLLHNSILLKITNIQE